MMTGSSQPSPDWTDKLYDRNGIRGAIWFDNIANKWKGAVLIGDKRSTPVVYEAEDRESLQNLLASVVIMNY